MSELEAKDLLDFPQIELVETTEEKFTAVVAEEECVYTFTACSPARCDNKCSFPTIQRPATRDQSTNNEFIS